MVATVGGGCCNGGCVSGDLSADSLMVCVSATAVVAERRCCCYNSQ